MTHQARTQETYKVNLTGGGARCPDCGKVRYLTRAAAKRQAKRIQGREGRVNAYLCGDFWHLGHLPKDVIQGIRTRDDLDQKDT